MPGKSLKVLMAVPVGYVGGAENLFLAIASHLPRHGITPVLACMRPGVMPARAAELGVEAYAFEQHRYRQISMVWRGSTWLQGLARRLGVDLIHATHTAHVYAAFAARRAGVPEVWHLHDHPNDKDVLCRFNRRIAPTHLILTTHAIAPSYAYLRYPQSIIHPMCVDAERLRSIPADEQVRARYALPEGPLLLNVARLQAYKGHRYLVEAAVKVVAARPDAVFAIVGEAVGREQLDYLAALRAQVDSLGIAHRVRFLGFVPDVDLVNLYRSASALVHPAVQEGFGITLQEAMALGLPVVVAAAEGPKAWVQHNKTGLLVPTHDPDALAAAVLSVLNDAVLAQRLRDEGKRFLDESGMERMVQETIEVYRRVTGSHAAVAG